MILLPLVSVAFAIDVTEGEDLFAAIAALAPGDELVVHAGTYATMSSSGSYYRAVELLGTEEAPIVVRAADGEQVLIQGDPEGSQNTVDLSGSWYTWQGFEMQYGSHGLRLGTSEHASILDNRIHDSADVGLSMNRDGQTYSHMWVAGNEIYDTGGTGEAMYLGCNEGACAVTDSIIEYNYCHDTVDTEQGDGIELKSGSSGNIIRHNVIVNTNYPGITGYGTYGGAPNQIVGNLVWGTVDNGIQIVGEVTVEDNIVLDAGIYGIYSKSSQGAYPEDVFILNNTVLNAGSSCLRVDDWTDVTSATIANNALLCPDGTAIHLGSETGGAQWSNNIALGDLGGASGVANGGELSALVVDGDAPDLYPREGSSLIDAGDASVGSGVDFDCQPRDDPPDVGAYEWRDGGAPTWTLQADFKPACDTAAETGDDTGTPDSGSDDSGPGDTDETKVSEGDCGCATGAAPGWLGLLMSLTILGRRRDA